MATYLLTWNPNRFDWNDLQDCADEVKKRGFHLGTWGVGVSKSVRRGDRLFLIRPGKEPKGIVGSGWAESNVFENEHWEAGKYEAGKHARYVEVSFDKLLNPDEDAILLRRNSTPLERCTGILKLQE